ncbi:hypothetical protein D3C87_1917330 [compost metagenome]
MQRHRSQPQLPGALYAFFHRLTGDDLAKTLSAVHRQHRSGIAYHFGMNVKLQMPLCQ